MIDLDRNTQDNLLHVDLSPDTESWMIHKRHSIE
jgi:hypothetical protein